MESPVKDSVISQKISQKLSSLGVRPPSCVTVVSNKGNVTLSGTIQYEHQRQMALHGIRAITGVNRVADQMRVIPSRQCRAPSSKR